jgi:hypothetical protein
MEMEMGLKATNASLQAKLQCVSFFYLSFVTFFSQAEVDMKTAEERIAILQQKASAAPAKGMCLTLMLCTTQWLTAAATPLKTAVQAKVSTPQQAAPVPTPATPAPVQSTPAPKPAQPGTPLIRIVAGAKPVVKAATPKTAPATPALQKPATSPAAVPAPAVPTPQAVKRSHSELEEDHSDPPATRAKLGDDVRRVLTASLFLLSLVFGQVY